MPGMRNALSKRDENCLKSFFTGKEHVKVPQEFFKLNERWLSTNEIRNHVGDSGHLKNNLVRLTKFGLLREKVVKKGMRNDSYWFITYAGLYYVLSTLKGDQILKFIHTNKEIAHLGLIIKNRVIKQQILVLVSDIKNCVVRYEYRKIMKVIKEFFEEIEEHYVDWSLSLNPGSRMMRFNHETQKDEIF